MAGWAVAEAVGAWGPPGMASPSAGGFAASISSYRTGFGDLGTELWSDSGSSR